MQILNYENVKSKHCKNIQSLRIDNKEITNQNTIANIFNSYFLSIAESLKSGNNTHTNTRIKDTNPISYLMNSFHRPFPKISWHYAGTMLALRWHYAGTMLPLMKLKRLLNL